MKLNNILEIYQMIDLLEDFFNNSDKHDIVVGGIAGSGLFKHAIDAALTNNQFVRILTVEGCQDYIGLMRTPIANHLYYADLFFDVLCDTIYNYDPFKPKMFNPKPEYSKQLNMKLLTNYDVIIINDSHLIPVEYLNTLVNNFCGKVCILVDPYDINGELFTAVPTITDSLSKQPPIIAMARATYDVDTRGIDRSIKGTITEGKINKRAVGKIDDKQYITNDVYLADIIRHKQLRSNFRKNHKLLITSDRINTNTDQNGRSHALTKNSMCVVMSASSKSFMKLRIYSSKSICSSDVSYLDDPPSNMIRVKPANILTIDESVFHRYNHTVLVCNEPLTQRQKYSILKNSNNVTVGHLR